MENGTCANVEDTGMVMLSLLMSASGGGSLDESKPVAGSATGGL